MWQKSSPDLGATLRIYKTSESLPISRRTRSRVGFSPVPRRGRCGAWCARCCPTCIRTMHSAERALRSAPGGIRRPGRLLAPPWREFPCFHADLSRLGFCCCCAAPSFLSLAWPCLGGGVVFPEMERKKEARARRVGTRLPVPSEKSTKRTTEHGSYPGQLV